MDAQIPHVFLRSLPCLRQLLCHCQCNVEAGQFTEKKSNLQFQCFMKQYSEFWCHFQKLRYFDSLCCLICILRCLSLTLLINDPPSATLFPMQIRDFIDNDPLNLNLQILGKISLLPINSFSVGAGVDNSNSIYQYRYLKKQRLDIFDSYL